MVKINIHQSDTFEEIEINIKCYSIDKKLNDLISLINNHYSSLVLKDQDYTYSINPNQIFYIESIDDKTFVYLENQVLENSLRLYEVEETLKEGTFIRISKSCILNIDYLRSVKALLNGKYEAHLFNGEKLIISRHYVSSFKKKFGM